MIKPVQARAASDARFLWEERNSTLGSFGAGDDAEIFRNALQECSRKICDEMDVFECVALFLLRLQRELF